MKRTIAGVTFDTKHAPPLGEVVDTADVRAVLDSGLVEVRALYAPGREKDFERRGFTYSDPVVRHVRDMLTFPRDASSHCCIISVKDLADWLDDFDAFRHHAPLAPAIVVYLGEECWSISERYLSAHELADVLRSRAGGDAC